MKLDRWNETIESHFQQLAGGAAALRRWQERYTALLDAAYTADLARLTARYAAQRRAVEARRQTQHATADACPPTRPCKSACAKPCVPTSRRAPHICTASRWPTPGSPARRLT
jgi:hypothetical protein